MEVEIKTLTEKLRKAEEDPFEAGAVSDYVLEYIFEPLRREERLFFKDLDFSRFSQEDMMEGRPLYNFEYFLNRAYAFNRDKGKCRVCGKELVTDVHVHHINPHLPIGQVNRVANLACMHTKCHQTVHGREPVDNFYGRMKSEIKYFRDALQK